MTKEEINEEILSRKILLAQERTSGRTCRCVNEYVENFFQKPMGTEILICDHYYGVNAGEVDGKTYIDTSHCSGVTHNGDRMLLKKVLTRLKNEYPNVGYEVNEKNISIKRTTPTRRETLNREIEYLNGLLKK